MFALLMPILNVTGTILTGIGLSKVGDWFAPSPAVAAAKTAVQKESDKKYKWMFIAGVIAFVFYIWFKWKSHR